MFNGFGVQRQQVFSMTALPQRWRPRLRLEKGDGAGIQSFKYMFIKIYPIRIIGPSNGRVNEPAIRRGVLGPQNSQFWGVFGLLGTFIFQPVVCVCVCSGEWPLL